MYEGDRKSRDSPIHAPKRAGPDTFAVEDRRALQLNIQLVANLFVQQQVLHETLPPILILHLKCSLYDVTTDCIVKMNKPIQLAPELCLFRKDATT